MLMFDFGALPPEINSARMYSGPGAAPMTAAASAWDALAAQLDLFGSGYSSVLSRLQGESWSGGSAVAMAAAAAPYVQWATTTAARAEHTAAQARAAAAAYEAAFAATVPPPVIAANRVLLATLVATNFFGQNTPAIAATEAAYAEMWAQDAAAMYGYAASSSAAATLTPFSEPPPTTNPAGSPAQAAATTAAQTTLPQLMSAVPQQLQTLSTSGFSSSSILTGVGELNTLAAPLDFGAAIGRTVFSAGYFAAGAYSTGLQMAKASAKAISPAVSAGFAPPVTGGVHAAAFASVSQAERVGGLSVPQNWAAAAPASVAEPVASSLTPFRALPAWAMDPPTNTGGNPPTFGPMRSGAQRRTGNVVFRMRDRRFRMPRPAVGG
jgi:PPE-repeat protein